MPQPRALGSAVVFPLPLVVFWFAAVIRLMSFLDRFFRLSQSLTALSAELDSQPALVAAEAGQAGRGSMEKGKAGSCLLTLPCNNIKKVILFEFWNKADKCFKCSGDVGCFSAKR